MAFIHPRHSIEPHVFFGKMFIDPNLKTEPPFDIASLFENGERGALFNIKDSVMFKNNGELDKERLAEIVNLNNPIGLMLQNYELGVELASNPNLSFDDTEQWTKSATYGANTSIVYDDGKVTITPISTGYAQASYPVLRTEVGKLYKYDINLDTDLTRGGYWLMLSNSPITDTMVRRTIVSTSPNVQRNYSGFFIASSDSTYLNFTQNNVLPVTVDSVSVKEVVGFYLSQSTAAMKPLLKSDVTFDGIDDNIEIKLPYNLDVATVFWTDSLGSVGITEFLNPSKSIKFGSNFKDLGIIDRQLSDKEKISLTKYWGAK